MEQPHFIKGGRHVDSRGILSYINQFDLSQIRRFYTIEHPNTDIIRGWKGHRIEQRWFSVCSGSFSVKLVKIDNWDTPDPMLEQFSFVLTDQEHGALHIPKGYASCLRALKENSKVIVFADSAAEDAKADDYLFSADYFSA